MYRLALLCVMVVSAWAATEECYDRGDAGTVCDKRFCPAEEGVCEGKKCTCKSGRGQPELLCSNDDDFFASVLNDPRAWTMNNREEAELPVPCQFLFSHVRATKLNSFMSPDGQCEIRVNLNSQRIRGKMFIGGFAIAISCRDMSTFISPTGIQEHVYQADSYVNEQGKYCSTLQISTDGGKTFGDATLDPSAMIDMAPFSFRVDPSTSRVYLNVPAVGVSAQLRPADPQYNVAGQKWLPGFAVKYDADKNPEFQSSGQVVSLVPDMTLQGVSGSFRPATDELTYRAFTGPGNEKANFPNFSNKCLDVKRALEACPDQDTVTRTMSQCRFILASPKFVNCISDDKSNEVGNILSLYNNCISALCGQNTGQCHQMKMKFQDESPSCKHVTPDEMIEYSCDFGVE